MAVPVKHSTHLKHLPNNTLTSINVAEIQFPFSVGSIDTLSLHERCERDRTLLHTRSEEAQEYRRALLRGRRILIVLGGVPEKAFIYGRLRELGVHITILDSEKSSWAKHADVDEFITFVAVERKALAAIEGLQFHAVTTYWEEAVFVAARIGEELGIGTNPSGSFAKARTKYGTRMVMLDAGLPTPRYARIHSADDFAEVSKFVGFPSVLKPTSASRSIGVMRVNNVAEAHAAYEDILRLLNDAEPSLETMCKHVILEEMYVGDECDVDVLLSDGVAVYAKVCDNWACSPPWFLEIGLNCPSLLPERKQTELVTLAIDTLHAMGFRSGAFHVELIYTSTGARLIEVNARMGGRSVREANLVAWGVDLVEEHAMVSCGIPIALVVLDKPHGYLASCAINAPYSGTINASKWLHSLPTNPSFHAIQYLKKLGDKVAGPEYGMPDRIAVVLCTSDENTEDAGEQVRKIVMELAPVPIPPLVASAEKPYFFPHTKHPFVVERD